MAERVMRTVRAMPSRARTNAGMMSWRGEQQPAEGSSPHTEAKSQMASRASQKFGTAMPPIEKVMTAPSTQVFRFPASTPNTIERLITTSIS